MEKTTDISEVLESVANDMEILKTRAREYHKDQNELSKSHCLNLGKLHKEMCF